MSDDPLEQGLHQRGIVAGVAAYLVWGALTLYWRHLENFDAVELIGWRVICSAVIMAVVLSVTHRWQHLLPILRDRRLLGSVVLCAIILTINWTTYVWAVVHDHVIETALGYFLSPLGTIALGVVVLHEKLSRAQQFVFVLALVRSRDPDVQLRPRTVAGADHRHVVGCLRLPQEARAADARREHGGRELHRVRARRHRCHDPRRPRLQHSADRHGAQFALVLCSGFATIVPLTLFAYAAQRMPLTVMGPLNYIVPTINFCLGWLVFHESLPPSRVVGFALVWLGLAIATADAARRSRIRSMSADPILA